MNDTEMIPVEDEQLPEPSGFCPYCGQPVATVAPGMQLDDQPPF
jgi:hypothetical protein